MALYRLKADELPNLEKRLSGINLPVIKDDEVLDVETFALVRATPEILKYSISSLNRRFVSKEFVNYGIFFDNKRAFTYFLLQNLGISTIIDDVDVLENNLKESQEKLTRFLSIYAPGNLSDIEGQYEGNINGEFIHQALSSLFFPRGLKAEVDISSQHHGISYGNEPLNIPLETGRAYLEEMAKAIFNSRIIYRKLASALVFVTELSGLSIEINEQSRRKYDEVKTEVEVINFLLRHLATSTDMVKTSEGIKKLVALHNALGHLIKDIPSEQIRDTLEASYEISKFYFGSYSRWDNRYSRELISRKQLMDALDILPVPQRPLMLKEYSS